MKKNKVRSAVAILLMSALSACGGSGGGSSVASTPPPPAPVPTAAAVNIFPSPKSQEFAVKGVGDDLRIRYDATTKTYEVKAGSLDWTALVDDPLSIPAAGSPNTNFVFAGAPTNQSYFLIRAHYSYSDPDVRYEYSNLAAWGNSQAGVGGFAAFGMATPAGSIPITGSATYNGFLEGTATDTYFDNLYGGVVPGSMGGSIRLAFDFGSGNLAGSISPTLYLGNTYSLATLTFTNTVYSAGSTSFSGQFNTALSGPNSFSGLFTGPNAQELIGKYAMPYLSPITGTTQQSQGAFIAKR